ncbi:hypothetical protein KQH82_02535 [bacterium]|nr:hypothetical protein [bacterium]
MAAPEQVLSRVWWDRWWRVGGVLLVFLASLISISCYSFHYYETGYESREVRHGALEISVVSEEYLVERHGDPARLSRVAATEEQKAYYQNFQPADSNIDYVALDVVYYFDGELSSLAEQDGRYFDFSIKSIQVEQDGTVTELGVDSLLVENERYGGRNILSIAPLPFHKSVNEATITIDLAIVGIVDGTVYEDVTLSIPVTRKKGRRIDKY